MIRYKRLFLYLGLFVMMFGMIGCSKSKKDEKNQEIKQDRIKDRNSTRFKMKDDIVVFLDNYDIQIYNDHGCNYVEFKVITKKELSDEDLRITFDKDVEYNVAYNGENINGAIVDGNEDKDVIVTDRTCLSYNGVDWKEYKKINNDKDKVQKYLDKYNKITSDVIDGYFYTVSVIFKQEAIKESSTINKMFIEYNGSKIEKDIKVDFVYISDESLPPFTNTSDSKSVEEFVAPNNTGNLTTYKMSIEADKDFKITGIRCLQNNGIVISSVDMSGSINNNIQQKFQNEIELKKGDSVSFSIQLKDDGVINQLVYSKTAVISIMYDDNGQKGQYFDLIKINTSPLLDELFAHYVDGIDIMPYYNEFQNVIEGN